MPVRSLSGSSKSKGLQKFSTAFQRLASLRASVMAAGSLVGVRRDHDHRFQKLDAADQLVIGLRLQLLALEALGQRLADRLLVADGGQLRVAHHLRLEAVGQDVVDVVVDEILGDGGDALLGLEDVAGGAVLLLDGEELLLAALPEEVLELGVEAVLVLEGRVGGAALVEDLQGGAVVDGVHQLVGVDVLAEALHRALACRAAR